MFSEPESLTDEGARLSDLAKAFGWDPHTFARQSFDPGGAQGPEQAERRQFATLDRVAEVVAGLLQQQRGVTDDLLERWHKHHTEGFEQRLKDSAIQALKATKPRSDEHRAIAAVVCQASPRESGSAVPGTKMQALRVKDGRAAFRELIAEKELSPLPAITSPRVSDSTVDKLFDFITSSENVVMLSWGEKKVTVGGETHEVPALTRTRSIPTMYFDYKLTVPEVDRVGETTFRRAVKAITARQQRSVQAVDYYVSELIHGNRDRLEVLIKNVVRGAEAKARLADELPKVFEYIKNGYGTRVDASACPSHSVLHALRLERTEGGQVIDTESKAIFAWFDMLKSHIPGASDKQVVEDALGKVIIAMGHALRTSVQKTRIAAIEDEVRQLGSKHARLILDYKMKLAPVQWRESGTLHYGKRGMSYHGAALLFVNEDGELETHWLDTVVAGDSKQDRGATVAIVEDLLARARKILPASITDFTFQVSTTRTPSSPHPRPLSPLAPPRPHPGAERQRQQLYRPPSASGAP